MQDQKKKEKRKYKIKETGKFDNNDYKEEARCCKSLMKERKEHKRESNAGSSRYSGTKVTHKIVDWNRGTVNNNDGMSQLVSTYFFKELFITMKHFIAKILKDNTKLKLLKSH